MPKYLKNKRKRRYKNSNFKNVDTIEMSSEEKKQSRTKGEKKSSFRILVGKKKAIKIKRIFLLSFVALLSVILIVVSLCSPTGFFELVTNSAAVFTLKSNLPISLNGSETFNVAASNNCFYVLSDTDFSCYSNRGKLSFSDPHGFSSPVLKKSEARSLVYDQNGTGIRIYNANDLVLTKESQFEILSADIGRNGYFAFASKAENYTSMFSVFNKEGESIYEWYCPEKMINSIAVAPNGKSVAVVAVSVKNGVFSSHLYVLSFESADPIFQKEYIGEFIYGIESDAKKNFTVIGENFCDIIAWKNYSVATFNTSYGVDGVKSDKKYTVIASSRENNDGSSSFAVYNRKRKNVLNFDFDGVVNDFSVYGKYVFILSQNSVFLIDGEGKVAKKGDCGFGTVKIVPTSSSGCLAVGHNNVIKVSLQ